MDSNEVRITCVGLMLYNASRIYFTRNHEMVSLTEHIDCQILKDYKIWEIYFLFRVNRREAQTALVNKHHFLCTLY